MGGEATPDLHRVPDGVNGSQIAGSAISLLIRVEFIQGCMACSDLVNFLDLRTTLGRVFSRLLNWLVTGYNPVSRKII